MEYAVMSIARGLVRTIYAALAGRHRRPTFKIS